MNILFKHRGRIDFSTDFIRTLHESKEDAAAECFRLLFSEFYPFSIESNAYSRRTSFYGYSMLFDECEDGEIEPVYIPSFVERPDGNYVMDIIKAK